MAYGLFKAIFIRNYLIFADVLLIEADEFPGNLNQNAAIFIRNDSANVVSEMAAILLRPPFVNSWSDAIFDDMFDHHLMRYCVSFQVRKRSATLRT